MKTKKAAVSKLTVGLDLGDRHHHVCVLDEAGEILSGTPFDINLGLYHPVDRRQPARDAFVEKNIPRLRIFSD